MLLESNENDAVYTLYIVAMYTFGVGVFNGWEKLRNEAIYTIIHIHVELFPVQYMRVIVYYTGHIHVHVHVHNACL